MHELIIVCYIHRAGVAMDILGKDGSIAMMADEGGTALHLLARQEMLVEKRNSIMLPTYILFLITSHLDHSKIG